MTDVVHRYTSSLPDHTRYFVISRKDLRNEFKRHFYRTKPDRKNIFKEITTNMNFIFQSDPQEYYAWRTHARRYCMKYDDIFFKVIFLDIDGVLNDEGINRSNGVIIDPKMMKCLRHIVEETDAKIILSSS